MPLSIEDSSIVFPFPGGPNSSTPFIGLTPYFLTSSGCTSGTSTASLMACLASSSPTTSFIRVILPFSTAFCPSTLLSKSILKFV